MAKAKYVAQVRSTYDPWITVKKFFIGLVTTIIPVILLYAIEFLRNEEFPPEYIWIVPLLVAILDAIYNYLKHYGDTESVKVRVN